MKLVEQQAMISRRFIVNTNYRHNRYNVFFMKVLTKLKLSDVHELNSHEMKWVKGGDNTSDYCCTLLHIISNNGSTMSSGAWSGANYGMSLCYNAGFFNVPSGSTIC